ncbi:hypothetical protein FOA43_001078 [Brettanomyces nanus]|uniref:PH domain-containing protein n=1 Tax=Eeniella nana TaxID=13502 RepID=A0A875S365_EENNA|nr:uncharacterized protein FOA43_001078 [Brettanomyces nanus]QPG73764.1 hypothetical protein FOA43_001078 [Brettanomyces nanus]
MSNPSADLQSQLFELQKRMGNIPKSSEATKDSGPMTPLSSGSGILSTPRRALRTSNSNNIGASPSGKLTHTSSSTPSTPHALTSPASPKRVDFLSDLSDGLLVESRRLAYENKQFKKKLEALQAEKDKFENQSSNLALLNTKLSEKEEESGDRIWELETELSTTKERLDKVNVELGKLGETRGSLDNRIGETALALEASRAAKIQLEMETNKKIVSLTQEVQDLCQNNSELNDENDSLQKQMLDLRENASKTTAIDFSSAVKDLGDAGDETEQDISVLLEPEPIETVATVGNTAELERQMLQANLNHALATIGKLRQYIVKQRSFSSLSTPTVVLKHQHSPVGHVNRRLFKSSTRSPGSVLSPGNRKSEIIVEENSDEDNDDWEKYDNTSKKVASKLTDIPNLVKTASEDEDNDSEKDPHEVLADELGDISSMSGFQSSPLKRKQIQQDQGNDTGYIALPKGGDLSQLGDYDLVPMARNDFETFVKKSRNVSTLTAAAAAAASSTAVVGDLRLISSPEYTKLQKQLTDKRIEVEKLQKKFTEKDTHSSEVESKLSRLQAELAKKSEQLEQFSDTEYIKSKIEERGFAAVSKDDYEGLQEKAEETGHELAAVQEELGGKETELKERVAELETLKEQVGSQVSDAEKLQEQIDELKVQVQNDTSEIAVLQEQLATEKKEAHQEREEALNRVNMKERALQEITTKLNAPDASFIAMKASDLGLVAISEEEHKQLKLSVQRNEETEIKIKELETEVMEKEAHVNALEKQMTEVREELSEKLAEYKNLEKELNSVAEKLNAVEKQREIPSAEYIRQKAAALGFVVATSLESERTTKEAKDIKQKLDAVGIEVLSLKDKISESEKSLVCKSQELDEKEKYSSSLKSDLEKVQAELATTRAAHEQPDASYVKQQAAAIGLAAVSVTDYAALNQKAETLERELKKAQKEIRGVKSLASGVAGVALGATAGTISLVGSAAGTAAGAASGVSLAALRSQLSKADAMYEKPTADYIKSKSTSLGLVAIPASQHIALTKELGFLKDKLDRRETELNESKQAHSQEAVLLKQLLETKERKVVEMKNVHDEELRAKENTLQTEKKELNRLTAELESKTSELITNASELEARISEVEKLTSDYKQLEGEYQTLKESYDKPDAEYLKSKAIQLEMVIIPDAEYKMVSRKAVEKEKIVAQLNTAITQLNTEYSSAKAELGEAKVLLKKTQGELEEANMSLSRAGEENVLSAEMLAEKARRISELNQEVETRGAEFSELKKSECESRALLAKYSDVDTLKGLETRCEMAGLVTISKKSYGDLMAALSMLGSEFSLAAQYLLEPNTTEFSGGVIDFKSAAQKQAKVVNEYESPSIDYLKSSGSNMGLKILTMGEYIDLKAGENFRNESSGNSGNNDDEASIVSEKVIADSATKQLDAKSKELASLQKQIEDKEQQLKALERCLAGEGTEGVDDDTALQISDLKKKLESKRGETTDVAGALRIKSQELTKLKSPKKRLSLQQLSAVDVQLDAKKRELKEKKENLQTKSTDLEKDKSQLQRMVKEHNGDVEKVRALRAELNQTNDTLDAVNAELDAKQSAINVLEAYIASNKKDTEELSKTGEANSGDRLKEDVKKLENELAKSQDESQNLSDRLEELMASYAPQLSQRDEEIEQLKESLSSKAAEVFELEKKVEGQKAEREHADQYVARGEYDVLVKSDAEKSIQINHLEAQLRNFETQEKSVITPSRPHSLFMGVTGLSSESLHPVESVQSSTGTSVYVDAVSSQGEFQDMGIDEGEGVYGDSENVMDTEVALRDKAKRMGYALIPIDDTDQATVRSEESKDVGNTTIGTVASVGTVMASLPQVQAYANSHDLTLMPTAQASKLMRHTVTSQDLAAKAAEYSLSLVPEDELSELRQRAPANADQISKAAKAKGLLCIPEDRFIATTVCRKPDPVNVVVVPSSYYSKLIKSHEWYKVHRNDASAAQKRTSSTASSSAVSTETGAHHDVQQSDSSAAFGFNQEPPANSPAFALAQLARRNGGNVALDATSLHTVNTVISTKREMIAAITQTIIGEYLFKYFRKLGPFVSSVSESRHERYFWIHPYSLTLYWSTSNPSLSDPSENKIRALAIAHVKSVDDNNPLPPGLYHKSIIVSSEDGRSVKVTCPTRQRHNIWFNSIKFLIEKNAEGLLDDGDEENQYNETFTMDEKTEVERSQSQSFRHQQPRSSILASNRKLSRVNSRASLETASVAKSTSSGLLTVHSMKRHLANLRRGD